MVFSISFIGIFWYLVLAVAYVIYYLETTCRFRCKISLGQQIGHELVVDEINFEQYSIEFILFTRNLGVMLDLKLNWQDHVKYTCNRAFALMYRLNYLRRSTALNLRKHLICLSTVTSRMSRISIFSVFST